jgi:predicted RNA binding protein YcfA (HicA-like mRNA interferase family)
MQRAAAEGTVTVPVPDHTELKRGTLRSIIRQAGIPKDDFETP